MTGRGVSDLLHLRVEVETKRGQLKQGARPVASQLCATKGRGWAAAAARRRRYITFFCRRASDC
jgi:hypothetical protein